MATISKKSSLTTTTLLCILFLSVFVTFNSCKEDSGKGEWIPTPPDTSSLGKVDHFIPIAQMDEFRKAFQPERDSISSRIGTYIPESEAFNKEWLLKVLKDPNCVGLKIYYGVKGKTERGNEMRLMIVGVDEQGKDLYITRGSTLAGQVDDDGKGGLEWGQCTPPCSGRP
jgi:hypothetical protein